MTKPTQEQIERVAEAIRNKHLTGGMSENIAKVAIEAYDSAPWALDESEIAVMAFRYALGHMTFAPTTCTEWLKDNWKKINSNHQQLIQKEIREASNQDKRLGMDCDARTWLHFLEWTETNEKARG